MTGAIKYVATVAYNDMAMDFEFYTIEETTNFTATVLKHHKPEIWEPTGNIRVYISMENTEEKK